MEGIKIAVIGGGSSYTPEIIEGFIKRSRELPVREIHLIDIKEGEEKLNIVGALAKRMLKKAGLKTELFLSLDRSAALEDADFVVTQFRVGGLKAREKDERFPLKYNVIGQETTGPGGFAKALRTVPVLLEIARDMEKLCPNAWLINFTNHSGLVTEAITKYTKIRCMGLCNVPIHMKMDIATMLKADFQDIFIEFAGLNHLLWGTRVLLKGEDVTGEVVDKLLDGASLTMNNIADLKWNKDFLKALNMIPSPYHRYFYMTDRLLMEEQEAAAEGGNGTRAQIVQKVEERLFELYKDEDLEDKPKELEKRGGAYYSDAAVSLISAIYNDKREIHTVNIVNKGTIKELPYDSVIETNCIVGKNGAIPLVIDRLPAEVLGLLQSVKSYEINAVEAAVHGDKDKAILAMSSHPLVPSIDVAVKLVEEMLEINKNYLPQFAFDGGK